MKVEQINKFTEVKQKTNVDKFPLGPIVSQRDNTQLTTEGQTIITLPFSLNLDLVSNFRLEIGGSGLVYNNDFTFYNTINNMSYQILLKSPVTAGLAIDAWLLGVRMADMPNAATIQAQQTALQAQVDGMKSVPVAMSPVGTVGFPVNNFTGARYPLLTDFPNTTTLYMWRPGLSGFSTIQGGINLTENGTLVSAKDYLNADVDCFLTGSQYLSSADAAFNFTGSFSVGVWVYKDDWSKATSVSSALVSRWASNAGWSFDFNTAMCLGYSLQAAGTANFVDVSYLSSGWHFFSFVRTSVTSVQVYIDSMLAATKADTTAITAASTTLQVGSYATSANKLTNIRIGDVIVHNGTAWTAAQVNALYAAMLPNHTHAQQFAGHQVELNELNTDPSEVIALYKANSSNLVKDETMAYPLSNSGVVSDNGIFGIDNAWRFNGSSTVYQTTLLDVMPDKGVVIDFWFKLDNGRTGSLQYLFNKHNVNPTSEMYFEVSGSGVPQFGVMPNSATVKYLNAQTVLPTGGTPFYYVVCSHDVVNGLRLFINGVLEAQDPTVTTLMANGTFADFFIGRDTAGTKMSAGVIANFRIRNKIISQADVDIGYATRYPRFSSDNMQNVGMNVRPSGIATLEYQTNCPTVGQDATYSYRRGFTMGDGLRSGDLLKIKQGY